MFEDQVESWHLANALLNIWLLYPLIFLSPDFVLFSLEFTGLVKQNQVLKNLKESQLTKIAR